MTLRVALKLIARVCTVSSLFIFAISIFTSVTANAAIIAEFSSGISAGAGPKDITAGPDGNLWFTESIGNKIGRITPAGLVTEFSSGITADAEPQNITAGADGNLWFTELHGKIGRITPAGVVTEFPSLVLHLRVSQLALTATYGLQSFGAT